MNPAFKGVLWMTGAIISFTMMALAGRAASFEFDTFEIMLYRSILGVIVISLILSVRGEWHLAKTQDFKLHLGRNIAHFTGQNLWFFALTLIPLAQVFALEFTSPLWVILLAPIFLSERWRISQLFCAFLGFVGILIIARPGVIEIGPGFIAAAASAIGFAVTMIFTKKLTQRNATLTILFYLTLLQTIFGLICAGYDGDIALPTLQALPYLILIGFAGLTAHWSITTALKLAPATLVAPIDFARLPVIAIIGAIFYSESLDGWLILGAMFIFSGNYINILLQFRATRMAEQQN